MASFVEDFIKDVDSTRVSSPVAQGGFATGEVRVMSIDLLSMDYDDAVAGGVAPDGRPMWDG
jgi:hypothetical protein